MVRTRRPGQQFIHRPRTWLSQPTLAKDFENLAENLAETLATFVTLASIQPALRRLAKAEPAPAIHHDEGRQIA
jgi:hypothetical protein